MHSTSTATPPAYRDDRETPLVHGPGCATHTIFPNFGQAEFWDPEAGRTDLVPARDHVQQLPASIHAGIASATESSLNRMNSISELVNMHSNDEERDGASRGIRLRRGNPYIFRQPI
ncbi:hypothetical protein [Bradyrhizobium nitroreducens]|uniref:hypothetical protein n=1 Tax=Bradyrhizobium nitroreducens TaxID=709803 RepID=UPI00157F8CB0|nr:hypothetical protein [Bradyrhizobium nitroreducens]